MKFWPLLVVGVMLLSACSSSGSEDSAPEEESGSSTSVESGEGYPEAKQACTYWEAAKQQKIDTIGAYVTAAIRSADAAAASSSQWGALVADLNEVYPLVTDTESGSVTDMLTVSSRLDATCEGSDEWPGVATTALAGAESAAGEGAAADSAEQGTEAEQVLNLIEPEVLLTGVPSVRDLTEAGGKKWQSNIEYSIKTDLYAGPVRGASEARGNGPEEISPSGCDAVSLYAGGTIDGLPWLTNSWGDALQQIAEVTTEQVSEAVLDFDNPKRSASLERWGTQLRLATPESIRAVTAEADAAMESECRDADFDSTAFYGAAYEGCEVCQDFDRPERIPVVDQKPVALGSMRLSCFDTEYFSALTLQEQVGAVLTRHTLGIDGSIATDAPQHSRIKPRTTLTTVVELYNRLEDNLATPQGASRTPLTVDDVVGVCEAARSEAEEAQAEQERAEEAAKYGGADVVYEVVTYDGGNVTMKTPTGTSQQFVSSETTYRYNDFSAGDFLYVSVQNDGDRGSVECSIYVDGVRVSNNYSSSAYGIATCEGNR